MKRYFIKKKIQPLIALLFISILQVFAGEVLLAQAYDKEVWQVQPWVTKATVDKGLIGGEGGQVGVGITNDGVEGKLMFLTTDVGGIWRSLNGGTTWEPANGGLSSRGASGIAIDPNNTNRVITVGGNSTKGVVNQHGIYLSTDKGTSWELRLPLTDYCGYRDNREHLTFDKASFDPVAGYSKIAYWSRSDNGGNCQRGMGYGPYYFPGLYKSIDGGMSWLKLPDSDSLGSAVVKTNPMNGNVYLANKKGFFKSTDGGLTFKKRFDSTTIYMSTASSKGSEIIWLLTQAGLYKSGNGGDSFQPVVSKNFPARYTAYYINASPVNPNKMLLQVKRATYDDIRYFTHDGGLNWQEITVDTATNVFTPYNHGVTLYAAWHPKNEDIVFTMGSNIVIKSSDGGRNFAFAGHGISHTYVSAGINWSSTHPGVLATPTQDWNSALTKDNGRTWTYQNVSGLTWGGYNYGAYSSNGRVIIVGNALENNLPRKLTITRDGGLTWKRTNLTITGKEVGYGDPHDSTILFFSNYRTNDEGSTWQNMNNCDGVFTSSPTGAKELYGVKGNNLVRSYTSGTTWDSIGNVPFKIVDIAFDHIRNRLYIACRDSGFYQLDIKTGLLKSLQDRIPADQFGNKRFSAVAVDPADPAIVYLGSHRDYYATDIALVRSINAGESWQILTVAPRHHNSQYGVPGGYEATVIRVNPATRSLYVGTSCFGNWKFGPPAARLPKKGNKPDIVVTDIVASVKNPSLKSNLHVVVTVTNQGSIATKYPVKLSIKIDDVKFVSITTKTPLLPGQTVTITRSGKRWSAAKGTHTFTAVADEEGLIVEQSELNNVNASSIAITD